MRSHLGFYTTPPVEERQELVSTAAAHGVRERLRAPTSGRAGRMEGSVRKSRLCLTDRPLCQK